MKRAGDAEEPVPVRSRRDHAAPAFERITGFSTFAGTPIPDAIRHTRKAMPGMLEAHGRVAGTGFKDSTDQRRAESKILRLNTELGERVALCTAQLAAVNQEMEAFAYSVSHDLAAPLRAIDGFSQMVVEDEEDALSDAGRQNLGRVRVAAQRMGQLIEALLALPRLTRKKLDIGRVDLSAQAADALARLHDGDPGRRVLASVAQCCGVSSDADLLEVALTNLLGNSWQLTAQRDEAHIEVGELAIDGERAVSARDDGAGFDLAHAGKLFQPFERLHKAADYPGTGIGLATVRRIVVRLGGRYWAEGAPDKGAAFYYTVPDEAEKTA